MPNPQDSGPLVAALDGAMDAVRSGSWERLYRHMDRIDAICEARRRARPCGQQHSGRCTTTETFTEAQAERQLMADGFTFNAERGDYEKGDVRGRLVWSPDFCNRDDIDTGTRFFLVRPFGLGEIPILGGTEPIYTRALCPNREPEPHAAGEFPLTCYPCHVVADA